MESGVAVSVIDAWSGAEIRVVQMAEHVRPWPSCTVPWLLTVSVSRTKPLPVRAAVDELPGAEETARTPVLMPSVVGLNATVTMHDPCGASVLVEHSSPETLKAGSPVTLTPAIASGCAFGLTTVKVWLVGGWTGLMSTDPKSHRLGLSRGGSTVG